MTDQAKCRCEEVTTSFKRTMTSDTYVKLRRLHPQAVIDVRMSSAVEFAYADHGLEDFGIDSSLLSAAVTGDSLAVCELSLTLLELLIARDRAERRGATHLVSRGEAISDAMVSQLMNWMIDGLIDADNSTLPPDLIILIRHQTGGLRSDWHKAEDLRSRRGEAWALALELSASGEIPTARKLAKKLGANPSTVVRWLGKGALDNFRVLAMAVTKPKRTSSKSEAETTTKNLRGGKWTEG